MTSSVPLENCQSRATLPLLSLQICAEFLFSAPNPDTFWASRG
jgi:hypothetical protein